MKILLLEDEIMLNESICEYLEALGHSVESYFDGLEAFNAIKEKPYDLLILDINVPNMDGLTFLENIHKLKIHTPAIYISALVDIEDISRAYNLGCFDYLKKPFHLSYNDFDSKVHQENELIGDVIVRFIIDENGKVIQPEIIDTFNLVLNDVIIDKVKQMKFSPPLQNGRPVRVRYKLPIVFK